MSEMFRIDDSNMPVALGSALRVPSYAYRNWGIPEGRYRKESADCYAIEWEGGSPLQMQYVVEAITKTGLGNFSQLLRDKNAEVVSSIVKNSNKRINYLEPGAGVSTVDLYRRLEKDGVDAEKIFSSLVEPSVERIESAAETLEKMGLKRGKNFNVYGGRKDTDALVLVGPRSQDVVGTVAQIHHHAYLDSPLGILAATLDRGGYLVSSDWHNSLWEHPNRVYEFLDTFEWETKDQDMEAFCKMYPMAMDKSPPVTGPDKNANNMIMDFWKGWADVRKNAIEKGEFNPADDILMLEAHKPVERYIEEGKNVGFRTYTNGVQRLMDDGVITDNPMPLVEDSSILQTTVLQK